MFIFGSAVKVRVVPQASAAQVESFFGISGNAVLYGGSRGTAFEISGVLLGPDLTSLAGAESVFYPGAQGIVGAPPSILVDTLGRQWPNVYFLGEYQPDPDGVKATLGGWLRPYKLVMRSLY